MFETYRDMQFKAYHQARRHLVNRPESLIALEEFVMRRVVAGVTRSLPLICKDYNEASYLYPFWQNYPPEERGRDPRGDQYPWIEVGEHALGGKLAECIKELNPRDVGLPAGADQRFLIDSPAILKCTDGLTSRAWLHLDIKSVGPRDDHDHSVMSHNQISGDGKWDKIGDGIRNTPMIAQGARAQHGFHCSIPPVYVLSEGIVAPVVHLAIKPVYDMLHLNREAPILQRGQPLRRITFASIPNGLLLCQNPNYLKIYPGLLYPGKDDKSKDPRKLRARIDFKILKAIAPWRINDLALDGPAR